LLGKSDAAENTSLIESFLYPKFGPGQMWETVAKKVEAMGGRVVHHAWVNQIHKVNGKITAVSCMLDEKEQVFAADHVISTMPIKDLVGAIRPAPALPIVQVGADLQYRDFITVGVLYKKLMPTKAALNPRTNLVPDNWIYIQEPGVKVGRLQIFNNWSPYMVQDPDTVWVGLEFFAKEDDDLWSMNDDALKALALHEMAQLKLAHQEDALDCVVIRMPKAYPGYYGSAYERLGEVTDYLNAIPNLFLIGRNGMHRYNNQDHSMLSAKYAVEAIVSGNPDKSKIWAVNIDDDYHEEGESK
jgi:protoporphyrinogen oxidase